MFACSLVGRSIFFACLCGFIAKGVSGCQPVSVLCKDIKTKDGFKYDYDCNCGLGTRCEIDVKNETGHLIGLVKCGEKDCRLLDKAAVVVGIDRNNTVLTVCLNIEVHCMDGNRCWNYTAVGKENNPKISSTAITAIENNPKISSTAITAIENNTKISSTAITAIAVSMVFVVFVVLGCLCRKWKKDRTQSDATFPEYLKTMIQESFLCSPAEHDQSDEPEVRFRSAVNGGGEPTSGADQPLTAPELVSVQNGNVSSAAY
ncbi:uncharacterized protein LOC133651768 [Entelurus aequoreus]|uniref:uncharacterized protein LOC133651768 n=1 Tax=Entelurus aequoreus TaxID=161455 RepID=UPI002B1DF8CD|nr:uncharacterized protein LOC133651768 [Entelurus aequoreus]